jgi:hypothetical protein
MHILYLDESGVEQLGSGGNHFILLGVMIPADRWKAINDSLEQVKSKYGLQNIEIHTGWMHRKYSEQDSISDFEKLNENDRRQEVEKAIRRRAGIIGVRGKRAKIKAYRREVNSIRPYIHLSITQRRDCLLELAEKLTEFSEIRIFADAISKPDFIYGPKITPYEMSFEQVLTRSQTCLELINDLGILICDNNTTVAPRLTRLSRAFHQAGTFYRKIPNIVETPLFVDSSLTSMIQIADLCAFGLRRLLDNNEPTIWDIIETRVDRKNSKCVGVRHFTGKRKCMCRLCVAHGRRGV